MKTPTKLITIAAFIAVCACTNNKCTITGNVSGLEGEGWILLTDIWHDFNVIDSVRYKNGQFRFEIDKVDFETFVCITLNQMNQEEDMTSEDSCWRMATSKSKET